MQRSNSEIKVAFENYYNELKKSHLSSSSIQENIFNFFTQFIQQKAESQSEASEFLLWSEKESYKPVYSCDDNPKWVNTEKHNMLVHGSIAHYEALYKVALTHEELYEEFKKNK